MIDGLKSILLPVVVVILLVWTGANTAYSYGILNEVNNLELPIGEQGPIGDKGDPGSDGQDGLPPEHEWNGTQIRFMNPNGTWSDWIDLIGQRGTRGNTGPQGPRGHNGADGIDGVDCPCNVPPICELIELKCEYVEELFHKHLFNITVYVEDLDDDEIKVTIYNKLFPDNEWTIARTYMGPDGVTIGTATSTSATNGDNWWCVEMWDGSDLSYEFYHCHIEPTTD